MVRARRLTSLALPASAPALAVVGKILAFLQVVRIGQIIAREAGTCEHARPVVVKNLRVARAGQRSTIRCQQSWRHEEMVLLRSAR